MIGAGGLCVPNGRTAKDGRRYLKCGGIENPAGYCCEHGAVVNAYAVVEVCWHCGSNPCTDNRFDYDDKCRLEDDELEAS